MTRHPTDASRRTTRGATARAVPAPTPAARRRRADLPVLAFRAVALLVAAVVLTGPGGLTDLLAAFTLSAGLDQGTGAELHRWHHIDIAAYLSLLTLGIFSVAAWSPRRTSVVVQTVLASLAGFALLALTTPAPGEVLVPVGVIALLVIATYPRRRALLHLPVLRLRGRLALAAAALPTPFLVVNLWQNLGRQVTGIDPHAMLGHWAGAAALALALLLVAWLAATSVTGARGLAVVVAVTLLYLGGAALAHGSHDGAWSAWGAVSAIGSAVLFLASAREAPARAHRSDARLDEPAPAVR